MSRAEKVVGIAEKIYSARRSLKIISEPGIYEKRIFEWQQAIRITMERNKCDELPAAMAIIKTLQEGSPDSGMAQAWVLAALAEMIEPEPARATDPETKVA